MTAVQLAASQYIAYDMGGVVVASRSTRVHSLSEQSAEGPGICAVLRTGEELGNTDGVGVSLTITDAQLFELGYVKAEPIADQVSAIVDLLQGMPDEPVDIEDIDLDDFFNFGETFTPAEPTDYAYCTTCLKMVDPLEEGLSGVIRHDEVEVFCLIKGDWVSNSRHAVTGSYPCIDKRAVKSA